MSLQKLPACIYFKREHGITQMQNDQEVHCTHFNYKLSTTFYFSDHICQRCVRYRYTTFGYTGNNNHKMVYRKKFSDHPNYVPQSPKHTKY